MKLDLSIQGKNGLAFLIAASIIWIIITIIFLLPLEMYHKNIYMLFSTGLMFPLSVFISNVIKADWKFQHNPLGSLGTFLNVAQIIYFPLLFWAIANSPTHAVLFLAVIVGAHFFPYGWFYDAKPFYVMAPFIATSIIFIGGVLESDQLWLIPMSMVLFLILLMVWLIVDYKNKCK